MKRTISLVLITLTATLFSLSSFAGKPPPGFKGNGAPKGKFEKFLLVAPGNPNMTSEDFLSAGNAENSGGKAIFIPVKTTNGPSEIYCANADGTGSYIVGDSANSNLYSSVTIKGVKLNFVKDPDATSLVVVDRDATDGYAEVDVPADWANATSVDLYIRVLGKPGGCFEADGYTYDGNYYFWSGSAAFKRKAGQSTFVDAGELTNVYYCPDGYYVIPTGGNNYECNTEADGSGTTTSAIEINVFDNVFDQYFWDMTNDGVRVVQVLMRANF